MHDAFRLAVAEAPVGVALVDPSGTIAYANRECARIFGFEDGELAGSAVERLVPPDRVEAHIAHRAGYQANPIPYVMASGREFAGVRRDGSLAEVEVALNPYVTSVGEPMVVAIVSDISERRRDERALAASRAELERANRDLVRHSRDMEQFTYAAAHDLRQPLRGIGSLLDWILEDDGDELPDRVVERIELARLRTVRLNQLLADLLEYAKAAGRISTSESFDVREVVAEIEASLELPEGFEIRRPREVVVEGDRIALGLVLRNLVGNAVKHRDRDRDGRAGRVEIRVDERAGELVIEVEDDGPGIPPEYRDQVFDLFTTLRPRDEVDGSGMGLALVKRLVEDAGGTIAIGSGRSQGARFDIHWPVR
jgi:PAS domain S-box-containing protein